MMRTTYAKSSLFDEGVKTAIGGDDPIEALEQRLVPIYVGSSVGLAIQRHPNDVMRFAYRDCDILDAFHCWSVFMAQWPGVAIYALIGRE